MHLPPLTIKLLWATAICLLLPLVLPDGLLVNLMMWPGLGLVRPGLDGLQLGHFMPWQLLTHVLVNFGVGDLLFIGLTLVFFGADLEHRWGARRYGLFLLACGLGAALVTLALTTVGAWMGWLDYLPAGGASGLMFGILFAVAYLDPRRQVMLLIPPIPMQMQTMVAVFCGIQLAFGVFGSPNGIAQLGFLGGMLAAWLHIRYWRGEPPFRRKPRKPQLRRVV